MNWSESSGSGGRESRMGRILHGNTAEIISLLKYSCCYCGLLRAVQFLLDGFRELPTLRTASRRHSVTESTTKNPSYSGPSPVELHHREVAADKTGGDHVP